MQDQQYPIPSEFPSSSSIPQSPTVIPPSTRPTVALWVVLSVLLSAGIFGVGGYYFGMGKKPQEPVQHTSTTQTQIADVNGVASPSTPLVTQKMQLVETIAQYCRNNTIAVDKLPFTLSATLIKDYAVQGSIACYGENESYATIAVRVKRTDFSGSDRNMYFFHASSRWEGMGNAFEPISNYQVITINGQNYALYVRDPGPYGISSLGVWVEVIAEKRDPVSGTIVRAVENEILKDQDLIDLVKKYGEKQTQADSPEYIIIDEIKKTQFLEEVYAIAGTHRSFVALAETVAADLSRVSF